MLLLPPCGHPTGFGTKQQGFAWRSNEVRAAGFRAANAGNPQPPLPALPQPQLSEVTTCQPSAFLLVVASPPNWRGKSRGQRPTRRFWRATGKPKVVQAPSPAGLATYQRWHSSAVRALSDTFFSIAGTHPPGGGEGGAQTAHLQPCAHADAYSQVTSSGTSIQTASVSSEAAASSPRDKTRLLEVEHWISAEPIRSWQGWATA